MVKKQTIYYKDEDRIWRLKCQLMEIKINEIRVRTAIINNNKKYEISK